MRYCFFSFLIIASVPLNFVIVSVAVFLFSLSGPSFIGGICRKLYCLQIAVACPLGTCPGQAWLTWPIKFYWFPIDAIGRPSESYRRWAAWRAATWLYRHGAEFGPYVRSLRRRVLLICRFILLASSPTCEKVCANLYQNIPNKILHLSIQSYLK